MVIDNPYWIFAKRRKGKYPPHTERGGKWLIFVSPDRIDQVWTSIKKDTEEGKLGGASKVSTARENKNSSNPNDRVICVYTYDWTDREDVFRVRQELRNLGIVHKIPYKADQDTRDGKYMVTGSTRISKYFE